MNPCATVRAAQVVNPDITRYGGVAGRGRDGDRRRGRLSRDNPGQLGSDGQASGQDGREGDPMPCSEHVFLAFRPRQRAGVEVMVIHPLVSAGELAEPLAYGACPAAGRVVSRP